MIPAARRPISAKYPNGCEKLGYDKIRLIAKCCQVERGLHHCPQSQGVHQLQLHPGMCLAPIDTSFLLQYFKSTKTLFSLQNICRLSDMQFSFRQQSGPSATTNIEPQPSFDKTKKTESTVSIFRDAHETLVCLSC